MERRETAWAWDETMNSVISGGGLGWVGGGQLVLINCFHVIDCQLIGPLKVEVFSRPLVNMSDRSVN